MSAVYTEKRITDRNGVVLSYFPDRVGPHHSEQHHGASDRDRGCVLKAERALTDIETMLDALDELFSEVARERFWHALRTIDCALKVQRRGCGMTAIEVQAAA